MPRPARLDAPGALHHIIVRGIELYKIFKDDADGDTETSKDMLVIHSPLALLIVKLSLDIRRSLQSAANDLERKKNEVQIVCKGKLVKGDSFWVEYRGEKLPIDFVFGTPIKQKIRGFPVYTTSFNLSS